MGEKGMVNGKWEMGHTGGRDIRYSLFDIRGWMRKFYEIFTTKARSGSSTTLKVGRAGVHE
jgi:hypothetical protein